MPILSSKVLHSSRKEFDHYLRRSKASPDSKARYTRAWKEAHEEKARPNKPAKAVPSKVPQKEPNDQAVSKVAARSAAGVSVVKKIKYPIGLKRLDVPYDKAKRDFDKYDAPTQKRYWRAWQQRYEAKKTPEQKEQTLYRVVLSYNVIVDGQVATDEDGVIKFHWSLKDSKKKRLTKKDLELAAEEIKVTTNVKIFNVQPVASYEQVTGYKV
jgi:hypothetical protein